MVNFLKSALGKINQKYFNRGEREFCAELYHQLRILLEKQKNIEVTTETIKTQISYTDNIFNDPKIRDYFFNPKNKFSDKIRRQPDILIHDYNTANNQELIIEVKKNHNTTLIKSDLSKLIVYCCGRLNYKKGILILLNTSNQTIDNIRNNREIDSLLTQYTKVEIWSVSYSNNGVIINKI